MSNVIFTPHLEGAIKDLASSNDRTFDLFHPSSFGGCPRQTAYQYFTVPSEREFDPRMQRVWDNGHFMHDRYQQKYFRSCKDFIQYGRWRCTYCDHVHGDGELRGIPEPEKCEKCEKKNFWYDEVIARSEKYYFRGAVDMVVRHRETGEWYIVDLKSASDSSFKRTTTCDYKYKIQVSIYMMCLDINTAVVYYENKNTQYTKEFLVERDSQLEQSIQRTALDLMDILKNGKIPKRKYDSKSTFECRYCDFQRRCWKS